MDGDPGALEADRPRAVLERKIKSDGSIREYPCDLVHESTGLRIISFRMPAGPSAFKTPVPIPPGSITLGYFWKRRPYDLYRMRSPAGDLLAHRFDAVTAVTFEPNVVSYRDLALDWWVLPGDILLEEDRDEFEALVGAGAFTPSDIAAASRAARQVTSRYRHIIDDAAAIERKLVPA